MSRVKIRSSPEITLPEEAWTKLGVAEGDEVDIEVVEDGVLLRPVSDPARKRAWRELVDTLGRGRPTPEQAAKPIEEQEEEIFELVDAYRHRHV